MTDSRSSHKAEVIFWASVSAVLGSAGLGLLRPDWRWPLLVVFVVGLSGLIRDALRWPESR